LAYSVLLGTPINSSFSYIVIFFNIIFAFNYLPKCDYSQVDLKKFRKHLTWFVIIFIVFYELSAPFAQNKNSEEEFYDVHRVYKEGFVISHIACYYLGVAGFFLYLLRRRLVALLIWAYAVSLGARIGLIYVAIAIVIIALKSLPKVFYLVARYKYFIVLVIIVITTIAARITISKIGIEGLMVFTSGRSLFWFKAISQVADDGLSFINIFGRGPKYSNIYNKQYFGLDIWMHNDFIDILFNLGFAGLITYLSSFYNYIKQSRTLFLLFVFLFTAFFNGFLLYDALFIIVLSTLFSKKNITT